MSGSSNEERCYLTILEDGTFWIGADPDPEGPNIEYANWSEAFAAGMKQQSLKEKQNKGKA